jgi:hypothetical protein
MAGAEMAPELNAIERPQAKARCHSLEFGVSEPSGGFARVGRFPIRRQRRALTFIPQSPRPWFDAT